MDAPSPYLSISMASPSTPDMDIDQPSSLVRPPPPLPLASVTTPRKSYLPPCRVCGGRASGLYYCVNACTGCRMFFRRMLACSSPPVCQRNSSCMVEFASLRTSCAACRHNKCLAVGMKVNDKRVGRYSHARHAHYIKEVQSLELRLRVSSAEHHPLTREQRNRELDLLCDRLTAVFVTKYHNTAQYLAQIPTLEQRYTELCSLQDELIGPMKPLEFEEYQKIYQATGLDIDSRRTKIRGIFPLIEIVSREMYKFTTHIPGFNKLPMCDQAALVRACVPANDLVTSYHLYDSERQIWTLVHTTYRRQDLAGFHSQKMLDVMGETFLALQQLDLVPEECAALNAYIIVNADAELSAEGSRMLQAIRDTINDLLYRTIQQNHDDPNSFFAKVISVLVKIETANKIMLEDYKVLHKLYGDLVWPHQAKVVLGMVPEDKIVQEFQHMCKVMDAEMAAKQ